jgi:hypothetical protein
VTRTAPVLTSERVVSSRSLVEVSRKGAWQHNNRGQKGQYRNQRHMPSRCKLGRHFSLPRNTRQQSRKEQHHGRPLRTRKRRKLGVAHTGR